MTKKKGNKLGLALCSGGARGFANIGVIQELEKHNLVPDYIAGSSMGAIIGAAYASGLFSDEIGRIAHSDEWKEYLRFTVPKSGLIDGSYLREYFRKELKLKSFSKFKIPFRAMSTNVDDGESVILEKGDSAKAVYASLAIPGIFTPLNYRKMTLVDGGITNPLPTEEVKSMGADVVVGVDLSMQPGEMDNNNNQVFGFEQNSEFVNYMREKFKESQKEILKDYVVNTRKSIPKFAKNTIQRFIDRFYNPDKIVQKINLSGQFAMLDILSRTTYIMIDQLINEKINNNYHDIMVRPNLKGRSVVNADNIEEIIEAGRKAVQKQIPMLKKNLHTA